MAYEGFDYGGGFDQQAEMERLRLEAEMRARAEEDARRQADEAKRAQEAQAQASQPPRTLGDMLAPPAPPNPYNPGAGQSWGMPAEPGRAPLDVAALGQDRGTMPPPAGGVQESGFRPIADADAAPAAPAGQTNPYMPGATTYYGGTAFPTGTATPGRQTSEMDLDAFNQSVRNSELYQQFTRQRGIGSEGRWGVGKWSEADREAWKQVLASQGVQLPKGMKVDDGGNLNQVNTRNKKLIIGAALVGGTIATAGALGAFGGAAGAAGAGAGAAGAGAAGAGAAGAAGATAAGVGAGAAAAGAAGAAGAGMGASAWMPHVITGLAGLGSSYMGARAQGKAADAAANAQMAGMAASERTMREQMAFEREQRQLEREEAKARWDAEQEFLRKQWDASEEERMYQRSRQEARDARGGGGGGFSYSGPDPKALRREQAQRNLAALLAQGTPGYSPYAPATAAGPLGRV